MRARALLVALVLSGCLGPDTAEQDAPIQPAPSTVDAPYLGLSGCSELDYYYPEEAQKHRHEKLRAKTLDPAGTRVNLIVNVMTCGSVRTSNGSGGPAGAFFSMVSVEPLPELRIANVSSYVWIREVRSAWDDEIGGFFLDYMGTGPRDERFELTFANIGSNPNATAKLYAGDQRRTSWYEAESFMVGSPGQGKAGSMAAYVPIGVDDLALFRIDFTDYRSYSHGAARITYGALLPGNPAREPVPAYHNFDYGVQFTLLGTTKSAVSKS